MNKRDKKIALGGFYRQMALNKTSVIPVDFIEKREDIILEQFIKSFWNDDEDINQSRSAGKNSTMILQMVEETIKYGMVGVFFTPDGNNVAILPHELYKKLTNKPMSREYCISCGKHTLDGVCEECDLVESTQACGECGSQTNPIIIQCLNCGCAVCTECEDHEAKC